ncbi:hypothetical protein HK096_006626, partial [Nowakowskiella sp. JEL0078]
SELLATISDDFCIRIIDIEVKRVVREFWGHKGRISDLAFSPDGRWIVSGSLDGTLRVWDIPTAQQVDCFHVDQVATSLSFSPYGNYLVTTHVDQVGLANKSMYSNVTLRNVSEDAEIFLDLPTSLTSKKVSTENEGDEQTLIEVEVDELSNGNVVPDAKFDLEEAISIVDGMISISSLPKSRWQNLLSLEAIRKRNKPKEQPKAPEKAPFFLPTLPGVELHFTDISSEEMKVNESRFLNLGNSQPASKFLKNLREGKDLNDYSKFMTHMKELPPATLDLEIRMLPLDRDFIDLRSILVALMRQIHLHQDFELSQTYLNVILKYHADMIINSCKGIPETEEMDGLLEVDSSLDVILKSIIEIHQTAWNRLGDKFRYGMCMVEFIRATK